MSAPDELVHRRVLRAPRDLVWRCLTEPAELAQFWGPSGMTTPLGGIVVELWAGGRFETTMHGEHGSHRMVATFTEVVPPERMAWTETESGMHTTSVLTELADGSTEVVITQRDVPEPMRRPEARAGFLTSLDKLEAHLAHLTQGDPAMTDVTVTQPLVATTYERLADLLDAAGDDAWDAPSLCEKWLVRHVVAHVTMPVRMTPETFGAEMAAARGDFTVMSDAVAARDGELPTDGAARPAALTEVARLAAARRRGRGCREPRGHPLTRRDGRARPATRGADGGGGGRPRPAHRRAGCDLRGRPDGGAARGDRRGLGLGRGRRRPRRRRGASCPWLSGRTVRGQSQRRTRPA